MPKKFTKTQQKRAIESISAKALRLWAVDDCLTSKDFDTIQKIMKRATNRIR